MSFYVVLALLQSLITNLIINLQLIVTTLLNIILLDANFDKFTIRLHFLLIFFMFAKFLENQRSIAMLLIKC